MSGNSYNVPNTKNFKNRLQPSFATMKSKRNYSTNYKNNNNNDIGATVKERIEYFEKHTHLELNQNILTKNGNCHADMMTPFAVAQWHQFTKGRMIGKGSYCQVYASTATASIPIHCVNAAGSLECNQLSSASSASSSGNPRQEQQRQQVRRRIAVKCISNTLDRHSKRFLNASLDLCLEAKLLERLNHENIIRLHAVKAGNVEEAVNNRNYFIVLERLAETLQDRMILWKQANYKRWPLWGGGMFGNRAKREELGRVRMAAIGIAKGMEYLHSKGIIFRDLKPSNIGFDEAGTIKIFDFGIARELQLVVQSGRSLGFAGTPRYMANEVLGGAKLYTLSADVYSFGILLWEICTCDDAYDDIFNMEQYKHQVSQKGWRPPLFHVRNKNLRELIAECWHSNPEKRPSMTQVRTRLEDICIDTPTEASSDSELCAPLYGINKPSESEPTWRVSEGF